MDRREFVSALSTTALGVFAAQSAAAAENMPGEKPVAKRAVPKELKKIADATAECLKTGSVCLAHCQSLLGAGDTSLAECQRTVMNMLATCDGMAKVASYNNADEADIKAFARVCALFCRACEKNCEPHISHHTECKACHDSCKTCASACETYSA